ncbi:DUF368 domain-containing protein [Candidatus Woesebacteria bacterium]|nr:DUF368 domain-containing protein [Candidatus Woesebacteria bacterium]
MKKFIRLFFTGFMMGAADIVPGVSGGTIAFIFGIYEELLHTIKTVSGKTLRLALKGQFTEAIKSIPFGFGIPLGLGLGVALLSMARAISFLLVEYPAFLWSFFFGLVVASIILVRKRVIDWDMKDYLALLFTTVGSYILVGAVPVETPNTYLAIMLSGAIAICAMILPGISGSFLLVIMGKYEQILNAVVDRDIMTLAIFMIGIVIGISLFSRLLTWLFARHHDIVIAALLGFMIGSLRKIWPWKEVITTRINSHGEVVPLLEKNILPMSFDGNVIMCIVLAIGGMALIMMLEKFQVMKEHTKDIENTEFEKSHTQAIVAEQN